MTKKIIINQNVADVSTYEFDGALADIRTRIDEWIELYGADARLDFDPDHYYPYESNPTPRYNIKVSREETDEEYSGRKEKEARRENELQRRELEEFTRLQKKFSK